MGPLTSGMSLQFSDRDCKPAESLLGAYNRTYNRVALSSDHRFMVAVCGRPLGLPRCLTLGLAGLHIAATHHLQVMLVAPTFVRRFTWSKSPPIRLSTQVSPALWKSPRGDPNLYPAASFAITSNSELFWWTQRLGSLPGESAIKALADSTCGADVARGCRPRFDSSAAYAGYGLGWWNLELASLEERTLDSPA